MAMGAFAITWRPSSVNFSKKSSLKPLGQMNRNLVGSIYGRSSSSVDSFGLAILEKIFQKSTN
jgi:hypothetical protein